MKTKFHRLFSALVLLALSTLNVQFSAAFAQGTAFTYQGQLQNNGSPASGTYNLTFSLFNTNTTGVAVGGPVTNNAVFITNGLFTVLIDFGPGVFTGATNWLQIGVETNGVSSFTPLTPRQQLTPTPYAIYAENSGNLSGTLPASQLISIGNTNDSYDNFFVGPSGNSTMSGTFNTANGVDALHSNTSGSDNTANGRAALYNNRDGIENTAEGVQALNSNTNGAYNTANGYQALFSNTGGFFTGFGNTAVGYQALYANTTGTANIALGYAAGYNVTTGSANIEIGNAGKASDSGVIRIGTNGNQTATFIAGISGTTVSGSAVIVNASGQLGVAPSSQRFKQDIHSMDDESSVLMALRPVTFKYKPDIDPQGTPQFGLVAEEVAKVDSDLVVRDGKGQIFTVRYDAVNAMLLNEFLKEHRTVEEQSGEIQNLKHQNDSLEKRLNELEKAVARIAEKSGTTLALNSKATENK